MRTAGPRPVTTKRTGTTSKSMYPRSGSGISASYARARAARAIWATLIEDLEHDGFAHMYQEYCSYLDGNEAQVLLRGPSDDNVTPVVEELWRRLAPSSAAQS